MKVVINTMKLSKTRKAIIGLVLLALVVGTAFGTMFVIWTRTPSLVVYAQYYDAYLVSPNVNAIAEGKANAELTSWVRTVGNDHDYKIAIILSTMNQIDVGKLTVLIDNIDPAFTITMKSVDLVTIAFSGSSWGISSSVNLAVGQPLGTEVSFNKADVTLWTAGINPKSAVIISLEELQVAPYGSQTMPLATTINLGA